MREIRDHIVEGDLPQNQLKIEVWDDPGAGGANHYYYITGFDIDKNPSYAVIGTPETECGMILFQNGPIKEAGVNGVTQEALLAIVIDRLRSFQEGPYHSIMNRKALHCCEEALDWLKIRTKERLFRGVEGKTEA